MGRALSSVGGDEDFLAEIVGLTQAAWPTLLTELQNGVAQGNLRAVEATARLAKAAARNVCAGRAFDSALQLESMAHQGNLTAAQEALTGLEREVEILRFFLATLGDEEACR
jgi:hypothetical protein